MDASHISRPRVLGGWVEYNVKCSGGAGAPDADFVSGSSDAFRKLIEEHSRRLRGVVWSFVSDPDVADDVMQNVWCTAYFKRHTYEGRGNVGDWLRAIARRACLVELRRSRATQRQLEWVSMHKAPYLLSTSTQDSCPAHLAEVRDSIHSAMRTLSEREYAVVTSRLFEGCSTTQTARRIRTPEGTVKALLSRGRSKMRRQLVSTYGNGTTDAWK